MTTNILDVKLKRTLINLGSSVNIMPLSTLEIVGIPRDIIVEQPIELSG